MRISAKSLPFQSRDPSASGRPTHPTSSSSPHAGSDGPSPSEASQGSRKNPTWEEKGKWPEGAPNSGATPPPPGYAILEHPLPPGAKPGSAAPIRDATREENATGWPANNRFSNTAAGLKKAWKDLESHYAADKGRLGSAEKRELKKERDRARYAYETYVKTNSNMFGTGPLDREAEYRTARLRAERQSFQPAKPAISGPLDVHPILPGHAGRPVPPNPDPRPRTPAQPPRESFRVLNPPAETAEGPLMPRRSPFDRTHGPTREDRRKIQDNVARHDQEAKRATFEDRAYNTAASARKLAKAERDLRTSRYQEKVFQESNAEWFRNPEARKPPAPPNLAVLERPLPPGAKPADLTPRPDPIRERPVGWPANNRFSDKAADLKRAYQDLAVRYSNSKGGLGEAERRELKRERDQARFAYESFVRTNSNIFGTGALDKEADYRASASARRGA